MPDQKDALPSDAENGSLKPQAPDENGKQVPEQRKGEGEAPKPPPSNEGGRPK